MLKFLLLLFLSYPLFAQIKVYEDIGEVLSDYRVSGKTVVTFIGHSGQGYEDWDQFEKYILEYLDNGKFKASETIVNIGVTPDGIGKAYELVKKLNLKYETRGIVSSQMLEYGLNEVEINKQVDKWYVIRDDSWGGYLENSKKLSPTSQAMVDVSHVMVGLGGGDVGLAELTEGKLLGKNVIFYKMDINHQKAIKKAVDAGKAAPTEFLATASKQYKANSQLYFLDHGQNYGLEFKTTDDGAAEVIFKEFKPVDTDNYRKVTKLLRDNLTIAAGDWEMDFSESTRSRITGSTDKLEIRLGQQLFGDFDYDKATRNLHYDVGGLKLSVFDLRQFSKAGEKYLKTWNNYKLAKTNIFTTASVIDVHSHFGGALRGESLVKIGVENKVLYPTALLREMGIDVDDSAKDVDLSTLTPKQQEKLALKLSMHHSETINFAQMEGYYAKRAPITKDPKLFKEFLKELAEDYKRMGVDYAELSISDIVGPKYLNMAHEVLPQIEKETGVKLRFVVGIWRHGPPGYLDEMVEKVKHVVHSPYVVGVDFMGHETNSTRAFEKQIRELAELKKTHPHLKIKVHAGENPLFPDNVKVAMDAGADHLSHVLYGVDKEILETAKEKGVLLDFASSSNYSLNNVLETQEIPVKKYMNMVPGLRISLGTDGHGLYGASNKGEMEVAKRLGLTRDQMRSIFGTSAAYVKKKKKEFLAQIDEFKAKWKNYYKNEADFPKSTYNWAEYADEVKRAKASLNADMKARGIAFAGEIDTPVKFKQVFGDKTPLHFSGASKKSILDFSEDQLKKTEAFIVETLKNMDPNKVVIVTGGTDYGVEKIVHKYAKNMGFQVLGTLVTESSGDEIGALTHYGLFGDKWYDKSANVLKMVKENSGKTIFIGGGNILGDEIQAAYNVGIDFHLMKGVPGASSSFASLSEEFAKKSFDDYSNLSQRLGLGVDCSVHFQKK